MPLTQKSSPTQLDPALTASAQSLCVLAAMTALHAPWVEIDPLDAAATVALWPALEFAIHKLAHELPLRLHVLHHEQPFATKLTDPSHAEFSAIAGWALSSWMGWRWAQLGTAWYGATHALIHDGSIRGSALHRHHRIHHACGASRFSVVAPVLDWLYDSLWW